jgi:glycosyltransferase involved in cell wall biosynthesis
VETDDYHALAAALRRVLEDSSLAARLAAAGLRVASLYREERMVNDYLTLYEAVAAR